MTTQSANDLVSGRQLRAARHLALLSQDELAEAAGVSGRSIRTFERAESGRLPCTDATRARIVEALATRDVVLIGHPTPGARLASPAETVR